MGYIDEQLLPGEVIVCRARLHWSEYLPAAGVVALGAPLFLFGPAGWVAGGILVATGGVLAGITWVKRWCTEFAVTNRRIIGKSGLVSRRTHETTLARLEALEVEQTLTGRLLNFGTISITGTGGTPQLFRRIQDPLAIRRTVFGQADANAQPPAPAPAPPAAAADDVISRLERLGDLRERGVLTEEEFQTQKARLLG